MTTEAKPRVATNIEEISPNKTVTSTSTPPQTNRHTKTIQLTKRLQTINPEGKVTYDTGETPSHSFVTAFIRGLWACFTATNHNAVDIFGMWQRLVLWGATDTVIFRLNAPKEETRFGPVVGMGTRAVGNFDTRLETQIEHGTGSNQLIYGETTLLEPSEVAGALVITIHRTFANHSTSPITVSECGVYCNSDQRSPAQFHCIIRDLVSPAASVPIGHTVLLEYKIQTKA